jgi:hypothetical protein
MYQQVSGQAQGSERQGRLCEWIISRQKSVTNLTQTGSRGFGLTAVEDIKEDDFVIDYRGEIIGME